MAEPRRPPPPKSYIPLDLTTGPPKLPPRPTAADAGPPPNYTPPPPPLSDEEEEPEQAREPAASTPHSNHRPPPPSPYQTRPQPPAMSLPASHGGLRPPPSRPVRPPTTHTPSPNSLSLSSSSTHSQTSSLSLPRPRPAKGSRPEITVVSVQPMTGDAIPQPMSPEAVPTLPPSSPKSHSPRAPARKAPTRPPPSRKAAPPPAKDSPLPQPVQETTDGAKETPPSPVAPPRRSKANGGPAPLLKKPPLRKSNTLPPQSRPSPPSPQSPGPKRAPPKPAPYRGSQPAPPRPRDMVDSEAKPAPPRPREMVDSEAKPAPPRPREMVDKQPSEVKPAPPKLRDTQLSEAKPAPPRPRDTQLSDTKPAPPRPREMVAKPAPPRPREMVAKPTSPRPREMVAKPTSPRPREMVAKPTSPRPREMVAKPTSPRPREMVAKPTSPRPREMVESEPKPAPQRQKEIVDKEPSEEKESLQRAKETVDKQPSEVKTAPPRLRETVEKQPSEVNAECEPELQAKANDRVKPATDGEGGAEVTEPPQAKQRTKSGSAAAAEVEQALQRDGSRKETSHETILGKAVQSETVPKPRPRAASASRPQFHKPPPPHTVERKKASPPPNRLAAGPSSPALLSQPRPPSAKVEAEKPAEQAPLPKKRRQPVPDETTTTTTAQSPAPATSVEPLPAVREPGDGSPTTQTEKVAVQKRPGKPPPPRQGKNMEERARAPQRRMTVPSKPSPPRQPAKEATRAEERESDDGAVKAPVAARRMTLASAEKKPAEGEGKREVSQEPVKRRRAPMVIRPAFEEEEKSNAEGKSKGKKAVSSSPKPARPPSRPTVQPSKRETQPLPPAAQKSEVPSKTSSLRPAEPAGGVQTQGESSGMEPPPPERAESVEEKAREEAQPQAAGAVPDASHEVEKDTGRGEGEGDAAKETETGGSTEQGVVLRRDTESQAATARQETRPKRPRPMSMPPGRPGKPPKPAAPSAVGKNKPKPDRPPGRPAQGPSRPALGPQRPAKKPQTPTTPVDPNHPPELPPRPAPGHPLYKYVCSVPHGIAITNHESTDPSELPYEADDVIELIERVDRDWFYARNADLEMCEGMIPARDVRVVRKLPGESTVSGFEEGPCAVATFTFDGQSADELSFKEGDLIMLKTRIGDEWLRGKLIGGQEGIFPRSFVEIVEDLPADAVEEAPAPTESQTTAEIHGPHCVALYEFPASGADELSLAVGDVVELLARVGAEWLRGRLWGQEGIFPRDFVEIREDLPDSEPHTAAADSLSKALYDYEGQEGDLSLKAGERVRVVARVNEEWVEGEREDGSERGMFPMSFVDKVPADIPSKADTTEPSQLGKPVVSGRCEALFDFSAENSGELSFKTGDVIVTLEWVNEEWMTGRMGDQEGMFPVSFVKILEELPKQKHTADDPSALTHLTKVDDSLLPRAEALREFTATNSQHLSFKAGDVLNLLERVGRDWYSGENTRTGEFGDFPASAVRVIEPLP